MSSCAPFSFTVSAIHTPPLFLCHVFSLSLSVALLVLLLFRRLSNVRQSVFFFLLFLPIFLFLLVTDLSSVSWVACGMLFLSLSLSLPLFFSLFLVFTIQFSQDPFLSLTNLTGSCCCCQCRPRSVNLFDVDAAFSIFSPSLLLFYIFSSLPPPFLFLVP